VLAVSAVQSLIGKGADFSTGCGRARRIARDAGKRPPNRFTTARAAAARNAKISPIPPRKPCVRLAPSELVPSASGVMSVSMRTEFGRPPRHAP
jgi:hypothetical protein